MAAQDSDPVDAPRRSRGQVGGRNLPVAIAVGVALGVVFFGALFLDPWVFTGVVAVATAAAYVELRTVLARVNRRMDAIVAIVATWVMLLGAHQARHAGQIIGLLVLIGGAFVWHVADTKRQDVTASIANTILFGTWVGFLGSFAVLINTDPAGGAVAVLVVMGSAALADIGAFTVGVAWGRHRIAPRLSPNKTWEGFLGGVVVAAAVSAAVVPQVVTRFSALDAVILAVACAVAAFLGDLVESMVKRDLGCKDLGFLLPGHGGVLDRVDGMLFALPVGYFVLELL